MANPKRQLNGGWAKRFKGYIYLCRYIPRINRINYKGGQKMTKESYSGVTKCPSFAIRSCLPLRRVNLLQMFKSFSQKQTSEKAYRCKRDF